jgi:hypothetical protein
VRTPIKVQMSALSGCKFLLKRVFTGWVEGVIMAFSISGQNRSASSWNDTIVVSAAAGTGTLRR